MPERRARRTDALQNRELILVAALAALTESSDASINSIARRAGVGNATLYRHFPTREALVLEVYQHEVRQLVDSADEFLSNSEPGVALQKWVMRLAQYAITKHGLGEALRAATGSSSPMFADIYAPIVAALGRLLEAAGRAGVVRTDLDADDVILALAGLWEIDPATDWRRRAARLYELVLGGLRP